MMMGKTAQDHSRVGVAVKLEYSGGVEGHGPQAPTGHQVVSCRGPAGGREEGKEVGKEEGISEGILVGLVLRMHRERTISPCLS